MSLETVIIPCRSDNYAYLVREHETGAVALVDAPAAAPILDALAERDWPLDLILITHHHDDHIEGVAEIKAATGAKVVGAASDAHRLPPLDITVSDGDSLEVGNKTGHVFDASGHTVGHIAYHFPGAKAVFSADSLMTMGCGRIFEGTPDMMWDTLTRFLALPDDTLVYSGHEYTEANAKFALSVDGANPALHDRVTDIKAKRAAGTPTIPSTLALERATNPFLRAIAAEMKAGLGMPDASDVAVFTEIRARKDRF